MRWFDRFGWIIRVVYILVICHYITDIYVVFPYTNSELKPYFQENLALVRSFCAESQYRLPKNHAVYFGRTEGDIVAYCHWKKNGFMLVFHRRFWNTLNPTEKKQLMMHEMVHCMFRQDHFYGIKHHFMAPEFVPIPEPNLTAQFNDYLYQKCYMVKP